MKVSPPKINWKTAGTGIKIGGGEVRNTGIVTSKPPAPSAPVKKKTNP